MALATADRKNDNEEREVFARTPEIQRDENNMPARCEVGDQFAPYVATKGEQRLYFCGHHVRASATGLTEKGWTITPDSYAL